MESICNNKKTYRLTFIMDQKQNDWLVRAGGEDGKGEVIRRLIDEAIERDKAQAPNGKGKKK